MRTFIRLSSENLILIYPLSLTPTLSDMILIFLLASKSQVHNQLEDTLAAGSNRSPNLI